MSAKGDAQVTVVVNGEERAVRKGLSLEGLVEELGLGSRRVAIEVNLSVIPRSRYDDTRLDEGDRIEIVTFVGGG